jgi:hypothetical protein
MEANVSTETLIKGQAFDDTGICTKCGMDQDEYEGQGEPACTGEEADAGGTGQPSHNHTALEE